MDGTSPNIEDSNNEIEIKLDIAKLRNFIKNAEHEYLTTHKKLCFAISQRIDIRVLKGYYFGAIKVSDSELIIDSNHRNIAYKLANIQFEIIEGSRSFRDTLRNFNEIEIDIKVDWDFNHPKTRKYCTDNFLYEEDKRNN